MDTNIATEIQALQDDKTAIAAAIDAKGGNATGHGFDTFAEDIANLPFSDGTATFSDFTSTLTVTGLPFTPTKIFVIGADARLHLHNSISVFGSIGFNADGTYKILIQARSSQDSQKIAWSQNASSYVTVTANGFSIYHSEYCFAKDTDYFWIACA